jgi:hypothetical protein
MTEHKPPPDDRPPPGYSAFKAFLAKLVRVPKAELDEKEAEYKKERKALRKAAG